MTATTFDNFPELKPRAKAVVADAKVKHSGLERRVKSYKLWQWVFGLTILAALLIGLAVGVNFNEALLSNTREELTTADWWLRFASALAMEATLVASVAGVHIAFSRGTEIGKRIFGFLLGILLFVGVLFLASSIGYSKFANLLDTLWQGSNASATGNMPSFEPGAESAIPTDIPFALRLASSAMFLGAGILAAFAEMAWLLVTTKIAVVREQLTKYAVALDIHKNYEAARATFYEKREEKAKLEDLEYCNARAHTIVLGGVEDYRKQVEAARPMPINAVLVDRPTYERHEADLAKTEACLKSADDVMLNIDRVLAFINRLFPVGQSKTIEPQSINQKAIEKE